MLVSQSVGVLQFINDLQFIFSVVSDSDEEDPEDSEQDIVWYYKHLKVSFEINCHRFIFILLHNKSCDEEINESFESFSSSC